MLPTCNTILQTYLFFSLTCSQIWLSPILHDHQPIYFTNFFLKKNIEYNVLQISKNIKNGLTLIDYSWAPQYCALPITMN
jgi:hypothetical protein